MNWLVAEYAGIASNCELALALKKHIKLNVVYERADPYGLDFKELDIMFGNPPQKPFKPLAYQGELLIIVSTPTLKRLLRLRGKEFFKNWKRKIIIISDSWYMHEFQTGRIVWREFNNLFKELGLEVWVTHDKLQYRRGLPTKEFFQPFRLLDYDMSKNERLTVAHSPFKGRQITKGSDKIKRIVKKFNVKYDEISGVSWDVCVNRKARSHIFIDQIESNKPIHNKLRWIGGIGKSGFEALCLKTLLICRGEYEGLEIPAPPVAWCESNTFERVLRYYINNEKDRNNLINEQYQWAKQYLNPDFQARRILA